MGFWEKALAGAAPAAPAAAPAQRPWWRAPDPEPDPAYQQPPQHWATHDGQQLAVQNYGAQEDPLIGRIQGTGYIRKPPEWVQRQPTEHCPKCGGVNYAQIAGDRYGGLHGGRAFFRCFDCGHNSRGIHENVLNGMTGGGPVTGAARQTALGGANLRNFGLIT